MNNTIEKVTLKPGDKFVACWGYDQTQYSIYNVVTVKGKSVLVEGLNGWSNLSESDLAAGSSVKIYTYKLWNDLTEAEQADWSSRGFDRWNYEKHMRDEAKASAPVRTIKSMSRINGESWTYIWTLDNGDIVNSKELYSNRQAVEIVRGLKKCLVKPGYDGKPRIKIDEVIRASYDPNFNDNQERYAEQNEYTAYNGR